MTTDKNSYPEKHQELILISEHTDALLSQMRSQRYADMATFLNNLNHMERYQGFISVLHRDTEFWRLLKVRDTDLYIRIEAIQLSFGILRNLIKNLHHAFVPLQQQEKNAADKPG